MANTAEPTTSSVGRAASRGAIIAVAMGVMNIATYGYTIAVAYLIGKGPFGAFSALMGLLMVINVLALGLQATGARRIAANPDHVHDVERAILRVGRRSGLALGLICLAFAPLLNSLLRLETIATALLLGAAAVPLSIMGSYAGIFQGERRWGPLAAIYITLGVGRFVAGVVCILIWQSAFAAFLGVALAAWLPVLVGWAVTRRGRAEQVEAADAEAAESRASAGAVLGEVLRSTQGLLAFFVVSNTDVLLARALLPEDTAGLYAGGLILAKAVLFLPQFVVVVAFPSMAGEGADRGVLLKALGLTVGLGGIGVLGVLVLPDLALLFIGGSEFSEIATNLWLFAMIGTLLSTIQLLVYSVLARQRWQATLLIWSALLALVPLAFTVETARGLAIVTVSVQATLLVVLLAISYQTLPATSAESNEEPSGP